MREIKDLHSRINGYVQEWGEDGCWGIALRSFTPLKFVASWGQGWEHVSVSTETCCPTWNEMCFFKELFWQDEETVIQYHPPKSCYVNRHPYVLHMWRKIGAEVELPPRIMV